MQFRANLRRLLVILAVYVLLVVAPKYSVIYCNESAHTGSAPCSFIRAVQPHFDALYFHALGWHPRAVNYMENKQWVQTAHAHANSIKDKLVALHIEEYAATAYNQAKIGSAKALYHFDTTLKPHIISYSRRGFKYVVYHAKNTYNHVSSFVETRAWPLLVKYGRHISAIASEWFWKLWKKFEQSHFWTEVVVGQVQKIYQTYQKRAAAFQDSSLEPISAPLQASETAKGVFSSVTSVAAKQFAAGVNSVESAAPEFSVKGSTTEAEPKSDPTPSITTESADGVSHDARYKTSTPGSLFAKVARTVDQALKHLEEDAEEALLAILSDARPEIVELLRKISKFGDKAIIDLTEKANALESDSSKITEDDVYPVYDKYIEAFPKMAFDVRDRVEKLAEDALAEVNSVRLVTLDAIDDYFDIVLTDAAHLLSDGEWDNWKEYHQLKQKIKKYRKQIEDHEFNLDKVNVALRESQSISVILSQEYSQELTNLRARCQLAFQGDKKNGSEVERDSRNAEKERMHNEKNHNVTLNTENENTVQNNDTVRVQNSTESSDKVDNGNINESNVENGIIVDSQLDVECENDAESVKISNSDSIIGNGMIHDSDINLQLEKDVLVAPMNDEPIVLEDEFQTIWETHTITQTII